MRLQPLRVLTATEKVEEFMIDTLRIAGTVLAIYATLSVFAGVLIGRAMKYAGDDGAEFVGAPRRVAEMRVRSRPSSRMTLRGRGSVSGPRPQPPTVPNPNTRANGTF
jgi:hypothetical protein